MNWDYEVLAHCQFEVSSGDCGEPATHKVWWFKDDNYPDKSMKVCQEHFDLIKKTEQVKDEADK